MNSCNSCAPAKKRQANGGTSLVSLLLVVILPKCPFCIMAYTSAITMCGGPAMYWQSNNWVSYIPLVLSVVILAMILLNWRGIRTWFALAMAMAGAFLILSTHQLWLSPTYYSWGSGLLFVAIWANGSFMSFMNILRKRGKALFAKPASKATEGLSIMK
ncbi:MAG: hypothetical protein AAFQ98_14680 [Bacteroidota bacterium]